MALPGLCTVCGGAPKLPQNNCLASIHRLSPTPRYVIILWNQPPPTAEIETVIGGDWNDHIAAEHYALNVLHRERPWFTVCAVEYPRL